MKRVILTLAVMIMVGTPLPGEAWAQGTGVRVATWNIETVGAPGTTQYNAALAILNRINADVVAINEVSSGTDELNFQSLAADAGYPFTVVASGSPFESLQNALMSRIPFAEPPIINTSVDLSGDPNANDITRYVLEVVVDIPDNPQDLTLVVQHWKSGTADDEEFRRAVESWRVMQAAVDRDAYVIMGDVNEEIDTVPGSPDPFTSLPSGLPSSYDLGADLEAELAGPGIANNPFYYLEPSSSVAAFQLDGSDVTRPASGRRLDYIFLSPSLLGGSPEAEVYDSNDEGLPGGLPKFGAPLSVSTSEDASGHLLVFSDMAVGPAGPIPIPTLSGLGLIGMTILGLAAGAFLIRRYRTAAAEQAFGR